MHWSARSSWSCIWRAVGVDQDDRSGLVSIVTKVQNCSRNAAAYNYLKSIAPQVEQLRFLEFLPRDGAPDLKPQAQHLFAFTS